MIFGHDFGHELMPSDASHQQVPTQDANLIKTNLQVRRRAGHYGSRASAGFVRRVAGGRVLGQDLFPHRQRVLRGVRPARELLEDLGHLLESEVTVNGA